MSKLSPIHEENYKGHNIEIIIDDNLDNCREWDNLGTMLCFHRRYTLGDKHNIRHEDFNGWDEVAEYLKKELNAVIVLPLYLYDHSRLAMKVGSFVGHAVYAEWDSGQVGFIYVSREKLLKEYNAKKLSKRILERAESVLRSEVETYNDYLQGNVYGYIVEDEEGNEIDSCWGFYGDYEENALKEAKSIVDYREKENVHVGRGI